MPQETASFAQLEGVLTQAARPRGLVQSFNPKFVASDYLKRLRQSRRTAVDIDLRKELSFQIRKRQRQETKEWKSEQLRLKLAQSDSCKFLRNMGNTISGRRLVQHPRPDEFAASLAELFFGNPAPPTRPEALTEPFFTLGELRAAISKLKQNKGSDDAGLVPELLKCAPDCLLSDLLLLYNDVLYSGDLPPPWLITHFIMLPKSGRAKTTSDFRPIAIVRLFYKVFAYMLLARIEPLIEAGQPEEQHGFRPNRRLEEHLVTANLVVDKFFGIDMPVWVISLDLSKAFDRVDWNKLWAALLDHGVSEHIVWIIQCLYFSQRGCVRGELDISDKFPINGGVRQGCVLSPRLFTGVLQWAMRKWRSKVESKGFGIEMQDGLLRLLDLRFADDIFIFGSTSVECLELLDALEDDLDEVGLFLNLNKTVILTNEAQPPNFLQTRRQKLLQVKAGLSGHKWLGCIFCMGNNGRTKLDVTHHLQAASRTFFSHKQILCDHSARLKDRLPFFDATVSPVALFGAGHRTIHQGDLYQMDITFRKLLRAMVGPPPGIDWSCDWHVILHSWNDRVQRFTNLFHIKTWSRRCVEHYWKWSMVNACTPQGEPILGTGGEKKCEHYWKLGSMLQISHRNVGSAGYLLGTLWDVVALVAPGLVGRANLFRTLVIVIWAIGRFWLMILICGVD